PQQGPVGQGSGQFLHDQGGGDGLEGPFRGQTPAFHRGSCRPAEQGPGPTQGFGQGRDPRQDQFVPAGGPAQARGDQAVQGVAQGVVDGQGHAVGVGPGQGGAGLVGAADAAQGEDGP